MELTSFSLKLNELKEYDEAKAERQGKLDEYKDIQKMLQKPFADGNNKGPKTKQEIHARIGLNTSDTP
jgi:hypothetical protein